ncbi:MAG: flagellum-specific ATP synthase FliI, partial [Sphingomonadaceae bacterium]
MLTRFDAMLDGWKSGPLEFSPQRFGKVCVCDGGLIEVSGLSVPVGALCRIAYGGGSSLGAEVIGFRNGRTLMVLLGDPVLLRPGAIVRPDGKAGMVPVGNGFLGRAVDGLAEPIDGSGPIGNTTLWPSDGQREHALERAPVCVPFDTGLRAINALMTVGVGQRIGIMAGSGVGKSVLIEMIAAGSQADVVVVGLIGERAREVSDFVARHMRGDSAGKTTIVAVPADHAPNLRLRAARLATGMAEFHRSQGKRVLLIIDSLTRIAHAAREIALLLGEPGAARGYPPSALATITRLVERSGNSARSGGAV